MAKRQRDESGWAVVTGASSGLGAIFADQLAQRGHSLVLTGRDHARLSAVAQQVGQTAPDVDVELVVGDLGTDDGTAAACAMVRIFFLASRKTQSSSLGSTIMVTTASSGKSTVYGPSGRSDVSLIFGGSPAPLLWMSLIPSMTKFIGGTPSMPDGKSSSKPISSSSMRLSVVA